MRDRDFDRTFARQRHERPRLWGRNLINKETRMSTRNNVCHSLNLFPQSLTKKDKFPSTYFLSFTKLLSPKSGNPESKFWNCLMIDNHLSLSLFVSLLLSINRLLLSQFSLCSAFRWSILLLNSQFISFTYTSLYVLSLLEIVYSTVMGWNNS
jgi:hypothetical protein